MRWRTRGRAPPWPAVRGRGSAATPPRDARGGGAPRFRRPGFELELSSIDWACAYDLCITTTTTARPTTSTTRPTTTTTNPWEVIADWCTSGLCDEIPPGPPPQNTQDTVPYPTGDYTNPGDIQGPVNTAPTTTVPVVIMPAP
ncbi:MAG: hypothetical protein R2690_01730 [Acidimicrobiales bacterium]